MLNYENDLIEFKNAVEEVSVLRKRPIDEELLKLYGLYKQALEGNNKTPVPSFFSFKANSKWNVWKNNAGMGRGRARKEYIAFVQELKRKYS